MKKIALVSALIVTMALSGCNSTTGGFDGADPDARLISKDFNVEKSSYVTSCLVGAGVVGVGCMLIANSSQRAVCIAAAAAGCMASMGVNAILDNIRQNYHTKEAQLDALMDQLEVNRQKAVQMNAAAHRVYQDDHAKFLQMQKDIKANKVSAEQVKKSIAQYNANIKVLQENLEVHEENVNKYKEVRDGLVGKEMLTAQEKKKLKELDRQIASLEKTVDDLRSVYSSNVDDRNVLNLALEKGVEINAQA